MLSKNGLMLLLEQTRGLIKEQLARPNSQYETSCHGSMRVEATTSESGAVYVSREGERGEILFIKLKYKLNR